MNTGLLIEGTNVRLYKYLGGVSPYEVVCAKDIIYERQLELIGATTPDSGRDTAVRSRLRTHFITINGASTSDNTSSPANLSIFHFLNDDVDGVAQDMEIVFTDNNGDDRSIRGDFYIENIRMDSPAGQPATYEMKMRASDGVTVSTLVDPSASGINVTSDYYTVSGGKVSDSRWIGLPSANIIMVCREGTEQLSMNLPYTFNSATGEITPDAATTINGQRVFVMWVY